MDKTEKKTPCKTTEEANARFNDQLQQSVEAGVMTAADAATASYLNALAKYSPLADDIDTTEMSGAEFADAALETLGLEEHAPAGPIAPVPVDAILGFGPSSPGGKVVETIEEFNAMFSNQPPPADPAELAAYHAERKQAKKQVDTFIPGQPTAPIVISEKYPSVIIDDQEVKGEPIGGGPGEPSGVRFEVMGVGFKNVAAANEEEPGVVTGFNPAWKWSQECNDEIAAATAEWNGLTLEIHRVPLTGMFWWRVYRGPRLLAEHEGELLDCRDAVRAAEKAARRLLEADPKSIKVTITCDDTNNPPESVAKGDLNVTVEGDDDLETRPTSGEHCPRCGLTREELPDYVPPGEALPASSPPTVCMLVPRHISVVGGIKLFANPTVVEGNEPGDVLLTGVPVLGAPEIHRTHDGLPCPGTCVTLADELGEARAEVDTLNEMAARVNDDAIKYKAEIEALRSQLRAEAHAIGFVLCSKCGAKRTSPDEVVALTTYSCLSGCGSKDNACGTCAQWINGRCRRHYVRCEGDHGTHCKDWEMKEMQREQYAMPKDEPVSKPAEKVSPGSIASELRKEAAERSGYGGDDPTPIDTDDLDETGRWLWDVAGRVAEVEAELLRWKNNTDAEWGRRYKVEQRAKRAAQIIIEELGAMGPEGVESVARRACVALVARRERIEVLETQIERLSGDALALLDERTAEIRAELEAAKEKIADADRFIRQFIDGFSNLYPGLAETEPYAVNIIKQMCTSLEEIRTTLDANGGDGSQDKDLEMSMARWLLGELVPDLDRERLLRFSICPACTHAIAWGPGAPDNDTWLCTNQDCRLEGTAKNFTDPGDYPVHCSNCCGDLAEPTCLAWDAVGRVGPCENCGWTPNPDPPDRDERIADLELQLQRMESALADALEESTVAQQEVADLQGLLAVATQSPSKPE